MAGTLDLMVEAVLTIPDRDIPDAVLGMSRDLIVDTIGCGVGGRHALASEAARAFPAVAVAGEGGAVIGEATSYPPDLAAFWNSAISRDLDLNDTFPPATHPSDMIGALIACSRPARVSGRDMVIANIIAYEVYGRLSTTVHARTPLSLDYGYAVCVGATAGLCYLFGLSEFQTRQALSMAATSGIQLRANRAGQLSDYKGVQTPVSARDAVFFTHLARQGLSGPTDPFDGRHGIVELLEHEAAPLNITGFDTWMTTNAWLKYWPCTYNTQASVWGALELRKLVAWEDIESITLFTSEFLKHESASEPAKWDPQTRQTADHSLPYVFSRAMQHGTLDEKAYEPAAIADPVIRTLMNRITAEVDPEIEADWPSRVGLRIEAVDKSGNRYVVNSFDPLGHTRNPMTKEDIKHKFVSLSARELGEQAALDAFDLTWGLEDVASFETVLESLVPRA